MKGFVIHLNVTTKVWESNTKPVYRSPRLPALTRLLAGARLTEDDLRVIWWCTYGKFVQRSAYRRRRRTRRFGK